MVKYIDNKVVFEEIPDCVTLAVTISNCPFTCNGCHSDYLRQDTGEELNEEVVDVLLKQESGVNCFLFLGDGKDILQLCGLAQYIHNNHPGILTAVYSGFDNILPEYKECFDYVKTGKWIEKLGPLNKPTTNQRLYRIKKQDVIDITEKFWKRK